MRRPCERVGLSTQARARAGERGEDGEQTFSDIGRPDEVQKTIISTLSDRSNRRFDGSPSLGGVARELERLEALRDRGTLTDAEFEEQKRRLLG